MIRNLQYYNFRGFSTVSSRWETWWHACTHGLESEVHCFCWLAGQWGLLLLLRILGWQAHTAMSTYLCAEGSSSGLACRALSHLPGFLHLLFLKHLLTWSRVASAAAGSLSSGIAGVSPHRCLWAASPAEPWSLPPLKVILSLVLSLPYFCVTKVTSEREFTEDKGSGFPNPGLSFPRILIILSQFLPTSRGSCSWFLHL